MPSKLVYHPLWRSVARPFVLFLDSYCCRVCGYHSFNNHVHHDYKDRMIIDFKNLHTLCPKHHTELESGKFKIGPRDLNKQKINISEIKHLERSLDAYIDSPSSMTVYKTCTP